MKIYVDPTVMHTITVTDLSSIIANNNQLCFTNTVVDIKLIRNNPDWFEKQLKAGKILIECWSTADLASPAACLDEMVSKPFFWTSFNFETHACTSFEAVYNQLRADVKKINLDYKCKYHGTSVPSKYEQFLQDDWKSVDKIASLVIEYGLSKGSWELGSLKKTIRLSKPDASLLRISLKNISRTKVFFAAKKTGRWDIYSRFNRAYCKNIARQHCCEAILNATGSISIVPNE